MKFLSLNVLNNKRKTISFKNEGTRQKKFRNNNTLEKASCNILAPVSFGEKLLLEKAEALITKHQDILARNFPNSFEEYHEGIRKMKALREIMDQKSF